MFRVRRNHESVSSDHERVPEVRERVRSSSDSERVPEDNEDNERDRSQIIQLYAWIAHLPEPLKPIAGILVTSGIIICVHICLYIVNVLLLVLLVGVIVVQMYECIRKRYMVFLFISFNAITMYLYFLEYQYD